MNQFANLYLVAFLANGCATAAPTMNSKFEDYTLNYHTRVDPVLQWQVEQIDSLPRAKHGMSTDQAAAGLLDLRSLRVAIMRPDYEWCAASAAPAVDDLLVSKTKNRTAP